jgi:predicted transcriptional regulator of viral defense system
VLAAWRAVGKDIAIVSHDSALDLLGLSEIIPEAVRLIVPRSRRSLPPMWGVKIHTTERPIGPDERWEREGIAITSPTRSILDAAEKGADPEQIELAVVQAVERGLATAPELGRAASNRSRRVAELIEGAMQKAGA